MSKDALTSVEKGKMLVLSSPIFTLVNSCILETVRLFKCKSTQRKYFPDMRGLWESLRRIAQVYTKRQVQLITKNSCSHNVTPPCQQLVVPASSSQLL